MLETCRLSNGESVRRGNEFDKMKRHTRLFLASLFGLGLLIAGGQAFAAACLSNVAAGVWSAAGSWTACGGLVPGAADTATIQSGHVISLDAVASPRTVTGITVNSGGTLNVGSAAAAVSLTVGATGITTIGTGIFRSNPGFAATHTLSTTGNISNAGTFNLAPNATSLTNTTFNLNGNQTVSGAGVYTFNLITLNMGATNANVLDMQSAMTVPSPFLTITNGTYKHSNTSNITPWTAAVTIPASGGFWLNGAATVTGPAGLNVSVTGLFHISSGTMTIGNTVTTQLILNNLSTFLMDGGVLNVTGGLDSAATASTGTFTMSAGSINLMTVGTGAVTSFMLGSATTFNMSGGTITLVNGDNTTNDLELRSGTINVTGGTLQIGSAATTAANQFLITNGSGTSFTVWNLTLATPAAAPRTTTLGSAVNVLNSLTIQANNTLVGGGFAINVGDATGNATPGIGNWTNNGTYTTGTSTVSFVGPGAATLGGTVATTFNNLTINKSGGSNVSIACATPSPTVNTTLALTSGDIITAGTSPGCLTTCPTQVPIIVAAAGTLTGGSSTSYVQGALRKMFNAAATLNFRAVAGQDEFPVGDTTNYTPVEITAGTTSTAGSVTACVTPTDHPQVTTPVATTGIDATKSVNRYWSLTTATINTTAVPVDATFKFVAGDVDGGATTANFIVEDYGTFWSPTTLVTAAATSTRAQNIDLTSTNNDIAIGEPLSGVTAVPGLYNAFETATTAGAILGKVQTKVAGAGFSVDIVHINATKTGALAGAITVEVRLLDSSGGGALDVNGCNAAWPLIQALPNFAIPASGRGTIPAATVANSYRNVRFQIRSPVGGPYTSIGCSTDRFAIRPASLTVTAYDATWATAGIGRTLANTGASGGNVHKAATSASPLPFTLRATPLPATATNYDGTPTTVALFPTCGGLCTTVGGLSFTAGSWTAAGSGVRENATANYSEAGTFNLQLEDATYASVDAVDGSTPAMRTVPATASAQIGRFVPDHFLAATSNTPTFKTFNDTACVSRTFTYIGQPFGYVTAPQVLVTAQNAANATTTNYSGALWKISGTSSSGKDCTTNPNLCQFTSSWTTAGVGGNSSSVVESYAYTLTPASTPNWDNASAATAAATVTPGAGTGTIAISSSNTLAFLRNTTTPQAAFTANIADTISVQDASEVGSPVIPGNGTIATTAPLVFQGTSPDGGITWTGIDFDGGGASNGKEFRYGRLKLANAHGSELLDLPIPIQTQYWDATTSAFVTNSADNCTTIQSANIALVKTPAGCTTAVSGNVSFNAGLGNLKLSKPGAKCAADITVNLAAELPSKAYLQGKWSGVNYNQNPTARATFGVYKGSNEFIYLRENY